MQILINWFEDADISPSSIKSCGAKLQSAAPASTVVAPWHQGQQHLLGVPAREGGRKAGAGTRCPGCCFHGPAEQFASDMT